MPTQSSSLSRPPLSEGGAPSPAAPTESLEHGPLPVTVQRVLRVRLPCRRVPGPPLARPDPPTAPPPAVSPTTDALPTPAASVEATSLSRSESSLQAAQQFLTTSGASLLSLTNSSLYLTVRNTLEGTFADANASDGSEELPAAAEDNLLLSTAALTALKERFNSNASVSAGAAVNWKRLAYVRQQCRYTGEALVAAPSTAAAAAHETETLLPAPAERSPTAANRSVRTRLLESLLHPFALSSAASDAAGTNEPGTVAATTVGSSPSITVPHGEGVMTYVLYAMPKPEGYQGTGAAAAAQTVAPALSGDGGTVLPPAPFLPPGLIPLEYCPPLAELDESHCRSDVGAAASSSSASSSHPLLLALVVYEGSFVQGRRHGRGRLTSCGRMVVECEWVDDVPCLCVPQPPPSPPSPCNSSSRSTAEAAAPRSPPTLRRIDAHALHASTPSSRTASVVVSQAYMGSLALCVPATKRLVAKAEHVGVPTTVQEAHGVHYLTLPVSQTPSPSAIQAFRELTWVNHTVMLPEGFGEARYGDATTAGSASPLASARPEQVLFAAHSRLFHPPLWVPASCRTATSAAATTSSPRHALRGSVTSAAVSVHYCGGWSFGVPHGFGIELERLTDPSCAALAFSSASAAAGPPQYSWRTLFVGQFVRGKRRGPGTLYGSQGSEASQIVLCGTWPRSQGGDDDDHADVDAGHHNADGRGGTTEGARETVNVVLLPPVSGSGSAFFTLQGARWTSDRSGYGTGSGGGSFPSATLRQSPVALSGMWEPLFHAVDDVVAQPDAAAALSSTDGEDGRWPSTDGAAGVAWQHARRVMDGLMQSPECVAALRTFQGCFACIYGCDVAASPALGSEGEGDEVSVSRAAPHEDRGSSTGSGGKSVPPPPPPATAAAARQDLLRRLMSITTGSGGGAALSTAPALSYPWCPQHSWCGLANLGTASTSSGPQRADHTLPWPQHCRRFRSCVHEPLANGAMHQQPASKTQLSRRPPLSAVAAALEPHAAAHSFAHAMHAAAAMVSSLRLRVLSCFAAFPDLCEAVMTHTATEDSVIAYCWDVVYDYVGPLLHALAAAVAVADVAMVWELLGLDRWVEGGDGGEGDRREEAVREVVRTQKGWCPEGKETLVDFGVAVRRCRGVRCEDVVDVTSGRSDEADCVQALARFLEPPSLATTQPSEARRGNEESQLGSVVRALQDLNMLVDAPSAGTSAVATPSHKEALLRWSVLAACTPSAPRTSAGRAAQPFSALLIAAYILGGRVMPAYPCLPFPSSSSSSTDGLSSAVKPHALLALLTRLGFATRQVMHTHPSLRAQTYPRPVTCPLDVLACRLEYVVSPCATQNLLQSRDVPTSVTSWPLISRDERREEGGGGEKDGQPRSRALTNTTAACVRLEELPDDVLHWCDGHLTDSLTEAVLRGRLHHFWRRCSAVPVEKKADEEQPWYSTDVSLPPSALMRWVLGCLRGFLSSVGQPVEREQQAEDGTSGLGGGATTAAVTAATDTRTWKKFINAVFFTVEETNALTSAAAAAAPSGSAGNWIAHVSPLSSVDYTYLVALAHTLREVAGLDLSFTAHFVWQDEEEEEEDDDDGGVKATTTTTMHDYAESPLNTSREEGHARSRWRPGHSTDTQSDRRRNVFLSSSDSSVSVSTASSPPAAEGVEEAAPVGEASAGSSPSASPSPPSPAMDDSVATPVKETTIAVLPATAAAAVAASGTIASRVEATRRSRLARSHSSMPGAATTALPLGKEWALTVSVLTAEAEGVPTLCGTRAASVFAGSLLWEVMDRVCSTVDCYLHEKKPVGAAAEVVAHHSFTTQH